MAKALSEKQKRFVKEYLIDLNATGAADRAGYSHPNKQGPRLLVNVGIATAIERAKARRDARTEITQDRVVAELAKIGFSDIRKVLTDTGGLMFPTEWDDDTAAAISSIEVVTRPSGERDDSDRPIIENVHKIKAWDKLGALKQLYEHTADDGGESKDRPINVVIVKE